MSVNRERPHVLVMPEDDANRQLVNGFLNDPSLNARAIQPLPIAGGWAKVRDYLLDSRKLPVLNNPNCHLILLIDFDGNIQERTRLFNEACPDAAKDRVYLLGTSVEPEPLRKDRGVSLEKVGEELSGACANAEEGLWAHPMLSHNKAELDRLVRNVKPFLFRQQPACRRVPEPGSA